MIVLIFQHFKSIISTLVKFLICVTQTENDSFLCSSAGTELGWENMYITTQKTAYIYLYERKMTVITLKYCIYTVKRPPIILHRQSHWPSRGRQIFLIILCPHWLLIKTHKRGGHFLNCNVLIYIKIIDTIQVLKCSCDKWLQMLKKNTDFLWRLRLSGTNTISCYNGVPSGSLNSFV